MRFMHLHKFKYIFSHNRKFYFGDQWAKRTILFYALLKHATIKSSIQKHGIEFIVYVIIFKRQGIRLLREGKKKNKKAYVRKVARLR